MPIYEYRCSLCGHELEALQKVTDAPLADCPACGRPGLQKVLTAAGFHLKGSGWYATDFKGGAKKSEDKKEKKTEGEAKPDSKTETKSAASAGAD